MPPLLSIGRGPSRRWIPGSCCYLLLFGGDRRVRVHEGANFGLGCPAQLSASAQVGDQISVADRAAAESCFGKLRGPPELLNFC